MDKMKALLWSVPFLIIPASLLCRRFCPFRRVRWWFYAAVLAVAFFMNLANVSFRNELSDNILIMAVNFIIAEFFWGLRSAAKPLVFWTLFAVALCAFGFEFRHWTAAGTENALRLWTPPPAAVYCRGGRQYQVRERVLYASQRQARSIELYKQLGATVFEVQMKRYRTPRGYGGVTISYQWSDTPEGVRLDIHAAGRRIWTMGEGF